MVNFLDVFHFSLSSVAICHRKNPREIVNERLAVAQVEMTTSKETSIVMRFSRDIFGLVHCSPSSVCGPLHHKGTMSARAASCAHRSCCRSLRRKVDVFQLLLHTANHFFVELLLHLLGRVASTLVASFVPTPGAYFLVVLERSLTGVAGPSDVHPDLFPVSCDQGIHFFSVARVAIGILFELGPVSGQCGYLTVAAIRLTGREGTWDSANACNSYIR